jgi:transposase
MKMLPEDLPNGIQLLIAMLQEKDSQLTGWQSKYEFILEQWRLARQKQFGKSTESSSGQGELFDEAIVDIASEPDAIDTELETQTVSYTRQKLKRQPLPKDLPRKSVEIDLPESEKSAHAAKRNFIILVKTVLKSSI